MAGLTAAAAFAQRGWSVRVHERVSEVRVVGSGLSIFENALRVLRAIGAEEDATNGAREGIERETRDAFGRTTSSLQYATRMFEISREQVVAALEKAARRSGAEIVTDSTIVNANSDGEIVNQKGQRMKADLVIVADGIHSRLRDVLRVPYRRYPLKDGAIRMMLPRLPEELINPDAKKNIEYWSGNKRVLIAPCSDSDLYVALTTLNSDVKGRSIPIDKELWSQAFPALTSLFARMDKDARWDRFEVVKMKHWSTGRTVIIGDAAHAMAPNLGQAGACAMMNSLSMAVMLEDAKDIPTRLIEWEKRERPLTDHTQRYSSFYSMLTLWPDHMRSLAFSLIPKIKWLRGQHLKTALHIPMGTEGMEPSAASRSNTV